MTSNCYLCGQRDWKVLKVLKKKPAGETDYGIPAEKYYREICECSNCGVYFNRHNDLISSDFYEGHYNASIVEGNLERRFNKIIQFPFHQSDNKNRVLRIIEYLYKKDRSPADMIALDVGSGTGVFLHELMKFGVEVHSIDPDQASTAHALKNIGVKEAFTGSVEDYTSGTQFDLITFNKVLEHVTNPIQVLTNVERSLRPDGILYVELPDGSVPAENNELIDHSEFFLDHYTTFNLQSFKYLIEKSGFKLLESKQIQDPSGKYTIYGFASNL